MSVAPGKTVQIRIRCEGEESLVRLLSQLKVIELVAMLYEYGSVNAFLGRACDAVVMTSGEKDGSH